MNFRDYLKVEKFKNFVERENIPLDTLQQLEIQLKYHKYIEKEKQNAEKFRRLEDIIIPGDFDYNKVPSLSYEGREKLIKIKPRNLGQATRISGVSTSDIHVLLVYLGR